ncbi:hypothetical protein FHX44_116132 [Pseudonocardia hierapolitana]|uniref:HicB-like protein involved in pilus formation n=1 Tax=Pseudonocardia hierapolitana TaxID=1128676 RepID=A0A561SZ95_9PSEU|nr:hypothetical protein [Pseudonocardia hierapolitana]TWF80194.1 hypothetical protein FHX44_116132 [Pseudonocardia hierapolitana]
MDLTPHVERLRYELGVAAGAGGEDARALAERLTAPLESAVRLVLLEALSEAADEITQELAPGSVEMRLRGREPGFAVTLPPADDVVPTDQDAAGAMGGGAGGVAPPDLEDGPMTRINLRLPDTLKSRVEEAAGRERLSVNAWLVRAATAALSSDTRGAPPATRRTALGGDSLTGWVR